MKNNNQIVVEKHYVQTRAALYGPFSREEAIAFQGQLRNLDLSFGATIYSEGALSAERAASARMPEKWEKE